MGFLKYRLSQYYLSDKLKVQLAKNIFFLRNRTLHKSLSGKRNCLYYYTKPSIE